MTELLTIGKVAALAQVGVETIRFYEREGLLEKPARRESGYRQYPTRTADRLRFIKRGKELGFTLREIKELLELRVDSDCRCNEVLHLAEAKIVDIEARIAQLRRIKQALSELTVACRRREPTNGCPILAAMEDQGSDKQQLW